MSARLPSMSTSTCTPSPGSPGPPAAAMPPPPPPARVRTVPVEAAPGWTAAGVPALPGTASLTLVRLSNLVGLEPSAWAPDSASPGGAAAAEHGKYVIRWREDPDGGAPRGNARLVKWSDGSRTLHVGSGCLAAHVGGAGHEGSGMVARDPAVRDSVRVAGRFATRASFAPLGLDSEAHRKLREAAERRHKKVNRVAKHTVTDREAHPEVAHRKREQQEAERIRQTESLARRREREYAKFGVSAPGGGGAGRAGLSSRFLEEMEDDYGGDGFESDPDEGAPGGGGARSELWGRGAAPAEAAAAERRILEAKSAPAAEAAAPAAPKRPRSPSPPPAATAATPAADLPRAQRGRVLVSDDEDSA